MRRSGRRAGHLAATGRGRGGCPPPDKSRVRRGALDYRRAVGITIGSGRVESVNVAVVRDDLPTRTAFTGIDKRPVDGPVRLERAGVVGDAIGEPADHGGPDQAVYAYAAEDLEFWAAELGRPVGPGNVGE